MIWNMLRKWAFRGSEPPFAPLSASALLVLATGRMAYALMAILSLIWTFVFTSLVCYLLRRLLPRFGSIIILVFLSSLFASFFYLILYIANPVLAFECALIVLFTPAVYCVNSFEAAGANAANEAPRAANETLGAAVIAPLKTALSAGALIFAVALIREPLGCANLSLPGGKDGIVELFNANALFPYSIQVVSSSAGALLLLGYIHALFRSINRDRDTGINPEKKSEAAK